MFRSCALRLTTEARGALLRNHATTEQAPNASLLLSLPPLSSFAFRSPLRTYADSNTKTKINTKTSTGDCIVLKGLTFFARHGVLEEEAKLGQKFVVDVKLYCCLEAAGKTDDVSATVDYSEVYKQVKQVVQEGKRYTLIESVAQDIVSNVFETFQQVEAIKVRVKKPQVALMGELEYSGVQIHRFR